MEKRSLNKRDSIDRLPPNSPEAERGILGCILLSPDETIPVCIESLKCGHEAFYDLRHKQVFDTLLELYDERDPIDLISLQDRLRAWGLLEQVGGLNYLSTLPDTVPSAANIDYYIEIVNEKLILRRAVSMCTQAVGDIYECEGNAQEALDALETNLLALSSARQSNTALTTTPELVQQVIHDIEDMHQRGGACRGITTGYTDLDRMTDGLHPGEMFVIAARPSMGKTTLALNIADHVAIESHLPVGIFSLEMTARSLMHRMVCSRARVNLRNIREGFLADRDFPKITGAAGRLMNAPLYIDDSSGLSILQLRAKARRMHQRYNIALFVIDYLQLANGSGANQKFDNRQGEVSAVSGGIKALAKELNVPIIVLSQLNRKVEHDRNRRPRLSDIRESGSIEQDADVVSFLYKPHGSDDEDEPQRDEAQAIAVNLLIEKQRNGPTGEINLTFLKQYTRFESAARIADEDVPDNQHHLPYNDQ